MAANLNTSKSSHPYRAVRARRRFQRRTRSVTALHRPIRSLPTLGGGLDAAAQIGERTIVHFCAAAWLLPAGGCARRLTVRGVVALLRPGSRDARLGPGRAVLVQPVSRGVAVTTATGPGCPGPQPDGGRFCRCPWQRRDAGSS